MDYHEELVFCAFSGRWPFFLGWLQLVTGHEVNGQWLPRNDLDQARCLTLVRSLSARQMHDLCWREMIFPDVPELEHYLPVPPFIVIRDIGGRVRIVTDGLGIRCYVLLAQKVGINVHPGELEQLEAAGYPDTIEGVLAILWRQIAPPSPTQEFLVARVLLSHLRQLPRCFSNELDPFACIRALRTQAAALDQAQAQGVTTRSAAIAALIDDALKCLADQRLAQAVKAQIEARNT